MYYLTYPGIELYLYVMNSAIFGPGDHHDHFLWFRRFSRFSHCRKIHFSHLISISLSIFQFFFLSWSFYLQKKLLFLDGCFNDNPRLIFIKVCPRAPSIKSLLLSELCPAEKLVQSIIENRNALSENPPRGRRDLSASTLNTQYLHTTTVIPRKLRKNYFYL